MGSSVLIDHIFFRLVVHLRGAILSNTKKKKPYLGIIIALPGITIP